MRWSVLLLLLLATIGQPADAATPALLEPSRVLPAVIDTVEVHGLWRTKRFVVERELPWKPGQTVDLTAWNLGLRHLWDMGLFSRVRGTLVRRGRHLVARLDLEERWTATPLIDFGVGGGVTWWEVGLDDRNTLGRFLDTGGYFQSFGDFDGGDLWFSDPRFLDSRQLFTVEGSRLERPRPQFALQRTGARVELDRDLNETFTLGADLDYEWDQFEKVPGSTEALPPTSQIGIVGGLVRFGRVDTVRLLETGQSLELRPSVGITSHPTDRVYGALALQALFFRPLGRRFNFASRLEAGAMTPLPVESEEYVGGLDLVRGLQDSAIQTRLYALANLELRFVAFDSMLLAFQPAAFVDGVVARLDNGGLTDAVSFGAGLRILVPRLPDAGLRVDLAEALGGPAHSHGPSLSVGTYEFF